MSDFIYSNKKIENGILTNSLQSIYEESDKPEVKEFHGDCGSFAVSDNLYNGFDSYEDNEYIAIVIGGPILMYRNNAFLKSESGSEGTESIFQRWKNGEMDWDNDLSGPFSIVIIEKTAGKITFITDLMSFIPVYKFQTADDFMISTHVDILAEISGEIKNIDVVSEVDFIMHSIVTYPYTMYEKIKQVSPATVHKYNKDAHRYIENDYWLPYEENINLSIKDTSIKLRNSIKGYIDKIINETDNIAQFISGGEDSRTLSALLQSMKRDAFIFINEMNLEGRIAKKVAEIYRADLKVYTRHKDHYSHILPSCSDLVGSGSQYHHAHTYGFHKTCNLQSYDAVFGGLFSDALLKGARIKKQGVLANFHLKKKLKILNILIVIKLSMAFLQMKF